MIPIGFSCLQWLQLFLLYCCIRTCSSWLCLRNKVCCRYSVTLAISFQGSLIQDGFISDKKDKLFSLMYKHLVLLILFVIMSFQVWRIIFVLFTASTWYCMYYVDHTNSVCRSVYHLLFYNWQWLVLYKSLRITGMVSFQPFDNHMHPYFFERNSFSYKSICTQHRPKSRSHTFVVDVLSIIWRFVYRHSFDRRTSLC